MTRIAAITLFALTILLPSAGYAQSLSHAGAELTRTLPPSSTPSEPVLAPKVPPSAPSDEDTSFCTLRPYFRASIGGGAGIFLGSSTYRGSSSLVPIGVEGLGRLDLVFGHDIAADPGLRIQIQYRAVALGNQRYVAHRHLLELTMGLGSVFSFRAGGGATVRHLYQGGAIATGTISIGIDWTIDAFVISLDLFSLDFLPNALEWTPSLSFGFQIR